MIKQKRTELSRNTESGKRGRVYDGNGVKVMPLSDQSGQPEKERSVR